MVLWITGPCGRSSGLGCAVDSSMKSDNRQLVVFGVLVLLFLVPLSVAYAFSHDANLLTLLMVTPAISALIACTVAGGDLRKLPFAPRFRGNLLWYAAAWLLPSLIAFVGAALYFLLFPGDFDPLGSRIARASGADSIGAYIAALVPSVLAAIVVNPLGGLLPCLGEELAWRGYLLPLLGERMSRVRAVLASGFIWGIWHTPIVYLGYNYGATYPVAGVVAMVLFCMVMGCISGFLFCKTKSVWVPVVFHAAVNGIAMYTPSVLFMRDDAPANPFVGPDLTGIIGGAGFMLFAACCLFALRRMKTSIPAIPFNPPRP